MFSRARIAALILVTAGAVLVCGGTAQAQTASANFNVTATAVTRCSIAAGALNFGNYDPTDTNPLEATSLITVRCTRGTSATVGLNDGLNSNRTMVHATDLQPLPYLLFRDAGRTQTWGNAAPNLASYGPAGSNAPFDLTVYGRVPAGANVVAGAFTDTVVATINF